MKIFFIAIGIVFIVSVIVIVLFFLRIGKPVNETLSKSYYHHYWKDKIIYSPLGNWFELGYTELDTDPTKFVVIAEHFAKDDSTVFWDNKKVPHVDLATFWVDKGGIPKDASHVYYNKQYEPKLVVVEGADPKSYHRMNRLDDQYLDLDWAKDDFNYFFKGVKVDVDYKTFKRLNETLAIDSNFIYTVNYDEGLIRKVENPGG
ncbi:MAG: DKNYY domain-containing protein, partial [Cyclobacteriaceae bacterium]|nr:DKNYY domain-containing protein [Cyclobacteriaceae bacterium]